MYRYILKHSVSDAHLFMYVRAAWSIYDKFIINIESTGDQIIKRMVSDCFLRSCLTDKVVDPVGVYSRATMTLM